MQHEVGVAADGRGEVRVELLRKAEMPDLLGAVERALHGAQHHHAERALEGRALDPLEEAREVLLLGKVAAGDAELHEVRAQVLELLGVRRLVEAREDLHAARPQLLRDGLVRGHHALLDELVRLVVGAHLDAGHHALLVDEDLGLRHVHVERAGGEAVPAQLLRERVDGEDRLARGGRRLRGGRPAGDHVHHLLVGEAGLGADHGLREATRRAVPLRVEREERAEREAVLAGHERADAVRELLRQHRNDLVHEVDARRAAVRLLVERGAGRDEVRDVGDVHAEDAVALLVRLQRERVVVVARARGVAGEDELPPQVEALAGLGEARAHVLRGVQDAARERFGQVVLLHHGERVERRVVLRSDHVRNLALRREVAALPAQEPHHHAVARARALRVGHGELLPVGGVERLDAREAPHRGDGADDRPRRALLDAQQHALVARTLQLDGHRVVRQRRAEVAFLDPHRLVGLRIHQIPRAVARHAQPPGHRAGLARRLPPPQLLFPLVHVLIPSVRESLRRTTSRTRAGPASTARGGTPPSCP